MYRLYLRHVYTEIREITEEQLEQLKEDFRFIRYWNRFPNNDPDHDKVYESFVDVMKRMNNLFNHKELLDDEKMTLPNELTINEVDKRVELIFPIR